MRRRHPADHRIFGVDPVAEEEAQVRRKGVDVHPTGEVIFDERETIGEGQRQLGDRVRAGFCDVVARDAHRVEVSHLVIDEVSLHVTHHAQRKLGRENAGVLRLVLFQDIRLNRPAHLGQGVGLNVRVDLRADEVDAASAEQSEPRRARSPVGLSSPTY